MRERKQDERQKRDGIWAACTYSEVDRLSFFLEGPKKLQKKERKRKRDFAVSEKGAKNNTIIWCMQCQNYSDGRQKQKEEEAKILTFE